LDVPLALSSLILFFLIVRLIFVTEITAHIFNISVSVATLLLFGLVFYEFGTFKKNRMNIIAVVFGVMLLLVSLQYPDLF